MRERLFWRRARELLNDAARDVGGSFSEKEAVGGVPEDGYLAEITRNLINASNEDLAYLLLATSDEAIDADVFRFMTGKGLRKKCVSSAGQTEKAEMQSSNSDDGED